MSGRRLNEDEAKEIENSRIWRLIKKELEHRLESVRQQLETCPDEDISLVRKELSLYKDFLRLPEDVKDRDTVSVSPQEVVT